VPEFSYTDLLPTGADDTPYRRLTSDGVTNHDSFGRRFLEVEPRLLTLLTSAAMHDIAHQLRPAHLRSCGPSWRTRRQARMTGTSRVTC